MHYCFSAAAKLSVVAISCFAVACCAAESRMIDDASYKNHRTSSKNDTQNKYPVYSAQVYADLSNIKDYTAAETEQPKLTETPLDVVRIYITPATNKKRQDAQQAAVPTTQPPSATVSSVSRTSPHPMFYVTAVNGADHYDQRAAGAVYSVSSTVNVNKETADYRTSAVSESSRKSDGAKAKQTVKAQSQPQHLLYATTQSPLSPQPTFAVAASKAQPTNSSSVSKPFATVLVPKQMLDGGDTAVGYSVREDSFRPIAAPLYSYKPNVAVDSNTVPENRRTSTAYYNVAGAAQPASVPAKSVKSAGYAKSDAYKVQEEHYGPYGERSSDRSFNAVPVNKQSRDKPNPQSYVDRPLQTTESPVKRDHTKPPKDALSHKHHAAVPEKIAHRYGYGYVASDPSKYDKVQPYKSVPPKPAADQVREFYPATEVSARDGMSFSPYNSAGKYDVRFPPLPLEREKLPGSPPNKMSTGSSTWSTSAYSGSAASGSPEFVMDDVNAKDVLKSILRDMLKSKQQAEVKQPPKSSAASTDEFDSYFKINPVDLSLDSSNVETGKTVIAIYIFHVFYITKTVK